MCIHVLYCDRHGLVSGYWKVHLAWVTDVAGASHYLEILKHLAMELICWSDHYPPSGTREGLHSMCTTERQED